MPDMKEIAASISDAEVVILRLFVVPSETGMEAGNEEFNSGEKAIGTGPYKFVSWEPKGDLVLERNPDFWGD
ncbi:MAG: ABC transporter substrate-binding protein, partial [Pseudomonadota bacterium]|nr:ABC transporter substrate-binding protein [Pseudomonadota bacterium]